MEAKFSYKNFQNKIKKYTRIKNLTYKLHRTKTFYMYGYLYVKKFLILI